MRNEVTEEWSWGTELDLAELPESWWQIKLRACVLVKEFTPVLRQEKLPSAFCKRVLSTQHPGQADGASATPTSLFFTVIAEQNLSSVASFGMFSEPAPVSLMD